MPGHIVPARSLEFLFEPVDIRIAPLTSRRTRPPGDELVPARIECSHAGIAAQRDAAANGILATGARTMRRPMLFMPPRGARFEPG
jgi:hypothetical protein